MTNDELMDFALNAFRLMTREEQKKALMKLLLDFKRAGGWWTLEKGFSDAVQFVVDSSMEIGSPKDGADPSEGSIGGSTPPEPTKR